VVFKVILRFVTDSDVATLYKKLTNHSQSDKIDVYLKSESSYLRDQLHYTKNNRIGDIVVVAKEGGVIFKTRAAAENVYAAGKYKE